jgi:hypothetical protein
METIYIFQRGGKIQMNKIIRRLKVVAMVEVICLGLVVCGTQNTPKARLENKEVKAVLTTSNEDYYVEDGDIITIYQDDTYKVTHNSGSVEYYSQNGEELN